MPQTGEPTYPANSEELQAYCDRFIHALVKNLSDHLICVLLNGSWARAEAKPPISDVDMTIIIDCIDDHTSDALRKTWQEVNMGCANVVDLIELQARPRELIAMLCDKTQLLYGSNPFVPTQSDYAENVVNAASNIGMYARRSDYYHWRVVDDNVKQLKYVMTNKYDLKWLLKNLIAYRTGIFPANESELAQMVENHQEQELYHWSKNFTEDDYRLKHKELARTLSIYSHKWIAETTAKANFPQKLH